MFLLFRFIINLLVVIFIGKEIPGFVIKNSLDAFFFAVILSAINAFIRPVLTFITLPINILTLGLFSFIINLFTLFLASEISYGVSFESFLALFLATICVWVSGVITNRFIWRVNMY